MADELALIDQKRAMRAEARARLAAIDPPARRSAARAACERLLALDEISMAGAILFYRALREEIDPLGAFAQCLREGIRVALPRIDEDSREIRVIEVDSLDESDYETDRYGVPVPRRGREIRATELDAIVVPGLAFDRTGGRLGRGAGYYDRLLVRVPERCIAIGFAHACQIVERVPLGGQDRRVAALVTDSETRFTLDQAPSSESPSARDLCAEGPPEADEENSATR